MVSGAGIQAVQAVFLLLLVFVAMFAGLARRLKVGLSESGAINGEEQEARRVLLREALVHLDRKRSKHRDQSAMFGELIASYQQRLDAMPVEREGRVQGLVDQARRSAAILAVLQVEREALIRLRDEGQIDDEVLRTLQRELDLEESRVHTGSVVVQ
jgi:monovalent cation/hydrogen antiporter